MRFLTPGLTSGQRRTRAAPGPGTRDLDPGSGPGLWDPGSGTRALGPGDGGAYCGDQFGELRIFIE